MTMRTHRPSKILTRYVAGSMALSVSLLMAACGNHYSSTTAAPASGSISDITDGHYMVKKWNAGMMKEAFVADQGKKQTFTCAVGFDERSTLTGGPGATVTIDGLTKAIDSGHMSVEATSPTVASKIIGAGGTGVRVGSCAVPVDTSHVDRSASLDSFTKLDDPIQVLGYYYALSTEPVPYDQEAQQFDQEYWQTTDAFKRHDLLPAFQAKVDQLVASAKANPRFTMVISSQVGPYDFATHTFPLQPLGPDTRITIQPRVGPSADVQINFVADDKFNQLVVTDDAKARAIEESLSKTSRDAELTVYVQAVQTSAQNGQRIVTVVPIAITGRSGNLMGPHTDLFEIH